MRQIRSGAGLRVLILAFATFIILIGYNNCGMRRAQIEEHNPIVTKLGFENRSVLVDMGEDERRSICATENWSCIHKKTGEEAAFMGIESFCDGDLCIPLETYVVESANEAGSSCTNHAINALLGDDVYFSGPNPEVAISNSLLECNAWAELN